MALPLLVNGADCGPVNPLQGLSKRFDQDRGIQQDKFVSGRAGPSRQTFKTTQQLDPALGQEAARFFSTDGPQTAHYASGSSQSAFDLSLLHRAMPSVQVAHSPSPTFELPQTQSFASSSSSTWASDFMQHTNYVGHGAHAPNMHANYASPTHQAQVPASGMQSLPSLPLMSGPRFVPQPLLSAPMQSHIQTSASSPALWEKEFSAHHDSIQNQPSEHAVNRVQEQQSPRRTGEPDELARTAALLIDTVREDQNPKFQNSGFMKLMRGLRDGEVVLDGNELVASSEFQTSIPADVKGKGKATVSTGFGRPLTTDPTSSFHANRVIGGASNVLESISKPETQQAAAEQDENLAYFQRDNEDYVDYWANAQRPHEPQSISTTATTRQEGEWGELQRSWDSFEASTWGVRPVPQYQFQPHNPYLRGDSSQRSMQHAMHSHQSLYESVLELEADVQRDPTNASAWFNLGVKQQENEREREAVLALSQAIALDPTHLPAWLALAISHTNEGERDLAEEAINQWIRTNPKYSAVVKEYFTRFDELNGTDLSRGFATKQAKRDGMVECLMAMVRTLNERGELDADVQIALAVLLNTGEDYTKAQDCFKLALSVRPDDWQLYNRVGATLANSGLPEEALQYYYRAIELNPGYIRARFNIGIACLNMKRYEEATQYILDALIMQDSDGSVHGNNGDKGGVTSSTLWDSLRTAATYCQRVDLATLCDKRDLDGFRREFHG